MKALAALTDGSLPNQDRALQAGAPALLCRVAQAAVHSGSTADAETACKPCSSRFFLFHILTLSILLLRCLTDNSSGRTTKSLDASCVENSFVPVLVVLFR